MKAFIPLQELRFKLISLTQTCISSKSIMPLTKKIFPDSAIFIEKKRVENRLWAKNEFLWAKKNASSSESAGSLFDCDCRPGGRRTAGQCRCCCCRRRDRPKQHAMSEGCRKDFAAKSWWVNSSRPPRLRLHGLSIQRAPKTFGNWNHFQYSSLVWSEAVRAGRRHSRQLRAGTKSCWTGQQAYD